MKPRGMYRCLLLILTGGTMLATTTSCSTLTDTLVTSVSESLATVLETQINDYVEQVLDTETAS